MKDAMEQFSSYNLENKNTENYAAGRETNVLKNIEHIYMLTMMTYIQRLGSSTSILQLPTIGE